MRKFSTLLLLGLTVASCGKKEISTPSADGKRNPFGKAGSDTLVTINTSIGSLMEYVNKVDLSCIDKACDSGLGMLFAKMTSKSNAYRCNGVFLSSRYFLTSADCIGTNAYYYDSFCRNNVFVKSTNGESSACERVVVRKRRGKKKIDYQNFAIIKLKNRVDIKAPTVSINGLSGGKYSQLEATELGAEKFQLSMNENCEVSKNNILYPLGTKRYEKTTPMKNCTKSSASFGSPLFNEQMELVGIVAQNLTAYNTRISGIDNNLTFPEVKLANSLVCIMSEAKQVFNTTVLPQSAKYYCSIRKHLADVDDYFDYLSTMVLRGKTEANKYYSTYSKGKFELFKVSHPETIGNRDEIDIRTCKSEMKIDGNYEIVRSEDEAECQEVETKFMTDTSWGFKRIKLLNDLGQKIYTFIIDRY